MTGLRQLGFIVDQFNSVSVRHTRNLSCTKTARGYL